MSFVKREKTYFIVQFVRLAYLYAIPRLTISIFTSHTFLLKRRFVSRIQVALFLCRRYLSHYDCALWATPCAIDYTKYVPTCRHKTPPTLGLRNGTCSRWTALTIYFTVYIMTYTSRYIILCTPIYIPRETPVDR